MVVPDVIGVIHAEDMRNVCCDDGDGLVSTVKGDESNGGWCGAARCAAALLLYSV